MGKKKIKIHLDEKGKIEKELDVEMSLADVRKELLDIITFPFVFADDEEKEIPKENIETQTQNALSAINAKDAGTLLFTKKSSDSPLFM